MVEKHDPVYTQLDHSLLRHGDELGRDTGGTSQRRSPHGDPWRQQVRSPYEYPTSTITANTWWDQHPEVDRPTLEASWAVARRWIIEAFLVGLSAGMLLALILVAIRGVG